MVYRLSSNNGLTFGYKHDLILLLLLLTAGFINKFTFLVDKYIPRKLVKRTRKVEKYIKNYNIGSIF